MFNRNTQNLNTVATEFSKYKILIFKQIIREYILLSYQQIGPRLRSMSDQLKFSFACGDFWHLCTVPILFTELVIFVVNLELFLSIQNYIVSLIFEFPKDRAETFVNTERTLFWCTPTCPGSICLGRHLSGYTFCPGGHLFGQTFVRVDICPGTHHRVRSL